MKKLMFVLGVTVMAASLQVAAGAIYNPPVSAPEIDPGSAVSALGLLTGGVMVLRARWRR